MQVFKDTASMAVKTGKEEIVYGTAIQIFNCIKTGGEVLEGGLEEVIDTFRHTFVNVATSKVTFSLKNHLYQEQELMIQDPLKPQPKPGGRHVESRMVSSWERATMKAIRGNEKTPSKCSFCKAENCRITRCSKKAGWGIVMENGTKHGRPDSIAHLTSHLGSLMRADNLCLMTDWPSFGSSDLQIGVPNEARHMVIHGCHAFSTNACPKFIVAAVQFVKDGGDELEGFAYSPMACEEVIKAIHGHFKANNRLVFVSSNFHRSMHAGMMPNSSQMCDDEDSSESDNVVLSSLAKAPSDTETVEILAGSKRKKKAVNRMDL
jgi:hypothetical protein